MCRASNPRWEDFRRDEKRSAIWSDIEEELGKRKYNNKSASGAVVEDACPDCIQPSHDDAAVELLLDSADPVREEYSDVEAREVALIKHVRQ